jgi:hypothetical protein
MSGVAGEFQSCQAMKRAVPETGAVQRAAFQAADFFSVDLRVSRALI